MTMWNKLIDRELNKKVTIEEGENQDNMSTSNNYGSLNPTHFK